MSESCAGDDDHMVPMYCPDCDEMVPEHWDRFEESFKCPECDGLIYESKEEYINILHGALRFQREHGYGPWGDGDGYRDARGDR